MSEKNKNLSNRRSRAGAGTAGTNERTAEDAGTVERIDAQPEPESQKTPGDVRAESSESFAESAEPVETSAELPENGPETPGDATGAARPGTESASESSAAEERRQAQTSGEKTSGASAKTSSDRPEEPLPVESARNRGGIAVESADKSVRSTRADRSRADVGALFSELLQARARYQADETPLSVVLIAFRRFYAAATVAQSARFSESLPAFAAFFERIADVEQDEDAPGAWRAFENGVAAVERYDRRRRREQEPPARSIDELVALGVSRQQIARIYGFYTPSGDPDVAAVERREAWRPKTRPEEPEKTADEREIARLALEALKTIEATGDDERRADSATVETLRELAGSVGAESPETTGDEPESAPESTRDKIERELREGVPARQIAARNGVTLEDVRVIAKANGIEPTRSAAQLPPRLVELIQERRGELAAGRTYREIADAVSSAERVVTASEVERVLSGRGEV